MARTMLHGISLDTLLANTRDGVFVLDGQRRYVMFNAACERLTGYSAQEIVGSTCTCFDITHCRDQQGRSLTGTLCPGMAVFRGELESARQRMRITMKNGSRRWVDTIYTAVMNDDGTPECLIGVMRDASGDIEREAEWQEQLDQLRGLIEQVRQQLAERYGLAGMVTRSPSMQPVLEGIRAACGNSAPVLIIGESGSGKENLARTIHFNGLQKAGPFVPAGCAGSSQEIIEGELFGYVRGSFVGASQDHPGLAQAANDGTLFIEDIASLSAGTQGRLLRVIEDRSVRPLGAVAQTAVNCRVITAARQPMAELIASGALRQDLAYRLGALTITLPPLRDRMEDIPFLVEHFLRQLSAESTRKISEVEPAVWHKLNSHNWPGNIRELHNVIAAAFCRGRSEILRGEEIVMMPLTREAGSGHTQSGEAAPLDEVLAGLERREILAALERAGGQRSLAAKLMGISRSRLYRRMDALGIGHKY